MNALSTSWIVEEDDDEEVGDLIETRHSLPGGPGQSATRSWSGTESLTSGVLWSRQSSDLVRIRMGPPGSARARASRRSRDGVGNEVPRMRGHSRGQHARSAWDGRPNGGLSPSVSQSRAFPRLSSGNEVEPTSQPDGGVASGGHQARADSVPMGCRCAITGRRPTLWQLKPSTK